MKDEMLPAKSENFSLAAKAFLDELTAEDMKLIMATIKQKMTEFCAEAKNGSIIDVTNEVVIAGPGEAIRFIPCKFTKQWLIKDDATNQLIRIIPGKSSSEFAFEDIEDGRKIVRTFCYAFTGMMYKSDGTPVSIFPIQLNFGSTFLTTARVLLTKIAEMAAEGHSPFSKVAVLSTFEKSGKTGHKWWAWKIDGFQDATEKESKAAETWAMRLGQVGEC